KMKRLFTNLIIILLLVVFTACNSDSNSNTISVSELTDRENTILSTTSDQSFVFDFDTGGEYKEVSVWIERYEAGELVDGQLSEITTKINERGSIVISSPEISHTEKRHIFNIGIGSNGSTGSLSDYDTNSIDLDAMASVWGSFPEKLPLNEDEFVLAYIGYSENSMRSLTADFFKDSQGIINELKEYDVIYLFKAKFMK